MLFFAEFHILIVIPVLYIILGVIWYVFLSQEHTRTHTGEGLSTCLICERQFTRHQYLEKHMRTHTGEKPYTCLTCGKKFTQSSSLKVHFRIHTGEKPYQCQICERRFTTSSDLSAHSKKHKKYISL